MALVADIDDLTGGEDYVTLMTLHSAKGLEFPGVYLTGMEEGLFPSYMSITSDDGGSEVEEERRLCYVGITRAMESLTITAAKSRMVRGETQFHAVSRFAKEIPPELLSGEVRSFRIAEESRGGTYEKARKAFHEKPFFLAEKEAKSYQTSRTKKISLNYGEGDRVRHAKFGEGTVKTIVPGGRDYEVTVEFDGFGVKKMFAAFAKLQKI